MGAERPSAHDASLIARGSRSVRYRSTQLARRARFRAVATRQASAMVDAHVSGPASPGVTRGLFVLTDARTGSTLLMSYLGQLTGVTALPEVLNHGQYPPLRGCREPSDVSLYVRRLLDASPAGWMSVNIHPSHLAFRRMAATDLLAAMPESAVVHLYRNDLLAQYASLTLARSTGQWDRRGEGPSESTTAATAVHISPDDFWRFRADRMAWTSECERLVASWPHAMLLEYEQLAEAPAEVMRAISEVLTLPPPQRLTERLHKQEQLTLRDRVTNYQALSDQIGPLRYVRAPSEASMS